MKPRKATPGPTKPRNTFRNRIIQGEVQDENAFVLGGVAGHAGLFSTAEDVARFAHVMISGGGPILRPETIALFTRGESTPSGPSRALGWDTPSEPSQSGTHFGPRSYGHLGYTGTSLWIDPDQQLSITLLTNRTWPDCSNQAIKQVRPKIHDAVMEISVETHFLRPRGDAPERTRRGRSTQMTATNLGSSGPGRIPHLFDFSDESGCDTNYLALKLLPGAGPLSKGSGDLVPPGAQKSDLRQLPTEQILLRSGESRPDVSRSKSCDSSTRRTRLSRRPHAERCRKLRTPSTW